MTSQPAIIYYFYPHGSKNLKDVVAYPKLNSTEKMGEARGRFNVFCFDQEPLNFDHYEQITTGTICSWHNLPDNSFEWNYRDHTLKNLLASIDFVISTIYDTVILLHSEKNSRDVAQYQQAGYIPVHYWSHGMIARDWYRFAMTDQRLCAKADITHDFLVYSRDWSGTREYRLKFLELLVNNQLASHSKCYFKSVSDTSACEYTQHQFVNEKFCTSTDQLEKHLNISTVSASASADYDVEDHLSTSISVVLETQFDGTKIHLTEKICRALACGHPFILAAGPGSLRYLKTYGFETFSPWLDESYDTEVDSASRLEKIINSMKKFSALPQAQKTQTLEQINQIAQRNKQRFFSNDFYHCLSQELQTGLSEAFAKAVKTQATRWLGKRRRAKKLLKTNHGSRYAQLSDHVKIVRAARKNYALTMMPDQDSGKS